MSAILRAAVLAWLLPVAALADTYVYVAATVGGVIDVFRMNTEGVLSPVSTARVGAGVGPMAVSPDRAHLYAAVRKPPYHVVTLAIDPLTGTLAQKAVAPTFENFAYVSLDPAGRTLLGASYAGGAVVTLPVGQDGLITAGPRQVQPAGRNAHAIRTDAAGRVAFSTALGTDEVIRFTIDADSGMLTPLDEAETGAGSGPRHLVFSPAGDRLYVVTEFSGEVVRFDVTANGLAEMGRVSILPEGTALQNGLPPLVKRDGVPRIWAADILITPDGRFLYVTERTTSRISLIDTGGGMRLIETFATEKQPRKIGMSPDGRFLAAAGERSDRMTLYAIDPETGHLAQTARVRVGTGPTWVEFVPVP
ncbi:lactonase family protein [Falsirhodobacter deserti]|uniref:lactonase family protein n=1 Tax=Falsirhodobacter deserti TaxID=1365611 RepID=UPI000FE3DC6B|nr:beta-propeller fold lactonase family protein [Falsirhodobacter deserti]